MKLLKRIAYAVRVRRAVRALIRVHAVVNKVDREAIELAITTLLRSRSGS